MIDRRLQDVLHLLLWCGVSEGGTGRPKERTMCFQVAAAGFVLLLFSVSGTVFVIQFISVMTAFESNLFCSRAKKVNCCFFFFFRCHYIFKCLRRKKESGLRQWLQKYVPSRKHLKGPANVSSKSGSSFCFFLSVSVVGLCDSFNNLLQEDFASLH